jgi:IS30 family transposase
MLTREDDVEIHTLRKRKWKIAAIARHVGRTTRSSCTSLRTHPQDQRSDVVRSATHVTDRGAHFQGPSG